MKLVTVILICCVYHFNQSYKILGVVPAPPYSHFTLGFRLMKALADRGHEVTFINSHPQKTPIKNFKDVSTEDIKKPVDEFLSKLTSFGQLSYIEQLEWVVAFGKVKSRATLQNKNVQDLIRSNETFDLVIMNQFFSDAMAYFAYRFNCPLIILAPGASNMFSNYLVANPGPTSYVTHLLANYDPRMTFWQRLQNTYLEVAGAWYIHFRMIPEQNNVLKEAVPDAPDLTTILFNASLMLTASHISLSDPVPLQQNVKEIGGYHVLPPEPLPKDLQDFMDNSPEGVVIFSMGSNLKSSNFEAKTKKVILEAFSRIKQKVLWKFETDLPEKPDNVQILKWLPQSDILAHPNVVAFISHGGLLGTTEAVYHGIPILGLPVFWDQVKNIDIAVRKGYALKVDFHTLDDETFATALDEILNNPRYKKVAKQQSAVMHDQPVKQLDEAVFWCEYVVRHKGAPHLRSAALDLRWYELHLVDIILFIGTIIVVVFISVQYILSRLFQRKSKVGNQKKDN